MIQQVCHNSLQSRSLKVAGMLICSCLVSTPAVFSQGALSAQPGNMLIAGVTGSANVPTNTATSTSRATPRHSIKELSQALKSGDRTARGEAAAALGQSKDSHAVKLLIEALKDGDPYVRAIADLALIKIGTPAVQPLISSLKENDLYTAALSALALTSMEDTRAHDALMKALQEHNSRAIFGTHTYFVMLGMPGSESALIEALQKYPSREMAEEFFRSGNPALEKAANEWAQKYRQTLKPASTAASVRWGVGLDTPVQTASNPAPGAQ